MKSLVVLVTGCSSGIGRQLAQDLAVTGWTVVATARRASELADIGTALVLRLDVTHEDSIRDAVAATLARFGRIDVLVNNAGYALRGAVEELDIEAVNRMYDVNLNGIIRMTKSVAPVMRAQGSGTIVNIGSIGGRLAVPMNGAYASSKFAVEALSDSMRWELGAFGIRVILVEPGNIKTNFKETAERSSGGLFDNAASPYAAPYERYKGSMAALRSHEPGPEAVSSVVLRALNTKRPRARYRAAVPFSTRIALLLPDRWRDPLMRRMFGLALPKKRFYR
jgi:NAD(P)-dependent dehydrogenase (short-subunit alcohol dehydrogenase family)